MNTLSPCIDDTIFPSFEFGEENNLKCRTCGTVVETNKNKLLSHWGNCTASKPANTLKEEA